MSKTIPLRTKLEAQIASRMLGVLHHVASGVRVPHMFKVWMQGQVYAVPPERLEGYMESVTESFRRQYDWSLLDDAKEETRQAWRHANRQTAKLQEAERRIKRLEKRLEHWSTLHGEIESLVYDWWRKDHGEGQAPWVNGQQYSRVRQLVNDLTDIACQRCFGGEDPP